MFCFVWSCFGKKDMELFWLTKKKQKTQTIFFSKLNFSRKIVLKFFFNLRTLCWS
jgi:hypothetical protein